MVAAWPLADALLLYAPTHIRDLRGKEEASLGSGYPSGHLPQLQTPLDHPLASTLSQLLAPLDPSPASPLSHLLGPLTPPPLFLPPPPP